MSQFVYTVICEECGFSEDLRSPSTDLRGWAKLYENIEGRPVERGDLCSICFAKAKAKEKVPA